MGEGLQENAVWWTATMNTSIDSGFVGEKGLLVGADKREITG